MNRLKELRAKRKVTQSELAKLLKCSNNTISRYEIGEREPDFKTLSELADYFNVTTDYLLGRTDDPTPPFQAPTTFQTVPMAAPLQKKEVPADMAETFTKIFRESFGRDPDESDIKRAIRHLQIDAEFNNKDSN